MTGLFLLGCVSCDLTWPHLTSPGLIWPHLISFDLTWPHMTSPYLMWSHLTSCDLTWPHLTSPDIIRPHLASHDLIRPHVTSPGLTWLLLTSPDLKRHVLTMFNVLPLKKKMKNRNVRILTKFNLLRDGFPYMTGLLHAWGHFSCCRRPQTCHLAIEIGHLWSWAWFMAAQIWAINFAMNCELHQYSVDNNDPMFCPKCSFKLIWEGSCRKEISMQELSVNLPTLKDCTELISCATWLKFKY